MNKLQLGSIVLLLATVLSISLASVVSGITFVKASTEEGSSSTEPEPAAPAEPSTPTEAEKENEPEAVETPTVEEEIQQQQQQEVESSDDESLPVVCPDGYFLNENEECEAQPPLGQQRTILQENQTSPADNIPQTIPEFLQPLVEEESPSLDNETEAVVDVSVGGDNSTDSEDNQTDTNGNGTDTNGNGTDTNGNGTDTDINVIIKNINKKFYDNENNHHHESFPEIDIIGLSVKDNGDAMICLINIDDENVQCQEFGMEDNKVNRDFWRVIETDHDKDYDNGNTGSDDIDDVIEDIKDQDFSELEDADNHDFNIDLAWIAINPQGDGVVCLTEDQSGKGKALCEPFKVDAIDVDGQITEGVQIE